MDQYTKCAIVSPETLLKVHEIVRALDLGYPSWKQQHTIQVTMEKYGLIIAILK